jgi:hypothetical protein
MKGELNDWVGYAKRRDDINAAILGELATEGKTYTELAIKLRSIGVGDARSDDPTELAYSSTGAILRSAVNALRWSGRIYDSWDTATDRNYEKPFRFFLYAEQPMRTATGADLLA